MPISLVCSNCEKNLKIPDEMAGKKVRCPACKTVLTVPAVEEEEEAVDEDEAPPPPKKKPAAKKTYTSPKAGE